MLGSAGSRAAQPCPTRRLARTALSTDADQSRQNALTRATPVFVFAATTFSALFTLGPAHATAFLDLLYRVDAASRDQLDPAIP